MRKHLESVERTKGKRPQELETPKCPFIFRHVIAWFYELGSKRQAGTGGPLPISWSDIQAWASLTQTPITPEEVKIIAALDALWIDAYIEGMPKSPQT